VIIINGTICDKRGELNSQVRVENGLIKKIATVIKPYKNEEIIDATGLYIMPAIVDLNTSLGFANQSIFKTLQKIESDAVKGGVCNVVIQPQTPINTEIGLDYLISKSNELGLTKISVIASAIENNDGDKLNNMAIMFKNGAVGAFLNSDINANFLRRSMEYSAMYSKPLFIALKNKPLDLGGVINDSEVAFKLGLTPVQNATEPTELVKVCELSQGLNSTAVINSISLKRSVKLAKQIKSRGEKSIFCTDLHYFSLEDSECLGYNTFAKNSPPLRTVKDMEAIREAIKSGVISCIASGHTPVSIGNKDVAFEEASFGIESLALFLPICYTNLVKSNLISMSRLSELTSLNPAKIIGSKSSGLVKVGFDADLILFDPNSKYNMQEVSRFDSYKKGPYADKELFGVVKGVFKNGKRIL